MAQLKDIVYSYVTTDNTVTSAWATLERFIKEHIDLNEITQALSVQDISQFLEEKVPQALAVLGSGINTIVGMVSSLIAIIYLFFILADYEKLSHDIFRMVPPAQRPLVQGVLTDLESGMNSYFRGQSLIALCVGILFAIGFLIIDFPLAIPLGLFIGLLNLVPYLQVVGFIPTIMLSLLKAHETGENFWLILLGAVIVFAVVQAIQDIILTPRIMGHVTGLNGAVILLALSIWGTLLGFVGLIIALPLTPPLQDIRP